MSKRGYIILCEEFDMANAGLTFSQDDFFVVYDEVQVRNLKNIPSLNNIVFIEEIQKNLLLKDIADHKAAHSVEVLLSVLRDSKSFNAAELATLEALAFYRLELLYVIVNAMQHLRIFKRIRDLFRESQFVVIAEREDYRCRLAALLFADASFVYKKSCQNETKGKHRQDIHPIFQHGIRFFFKVQAILSSVVKPRPIAYFSSNVFVHKYLFNKCQKAGFSCAVVSRECAPRVALFCLRNGFSYSFLSSHKKNFIQQDSFIARIDECLRDQEAFVDSGMLFWSSIRDDLLNFLKLASSLALDIVAADKVFANRSAKILLVDEDVIAFNKGLVTVAKKRGIRTFVLQHGLPCESAGFTPLTAEAMIAFGQSSFDRFAQWGIPINRIIKSGAYFLRNKRSEEERQKCAQGIHDQLKIPSENKIISIFLPITRLPIGYYCINSPYIYRSNLMHILENLIQIIKEMPKTTLVIKPHHNSSPQMLQSMQRLVEGKAVWAPAAQTYDLIPSSCAVICGWSTIYLDCLFLNVPCFIMYGKPYFDVQDDFLLDARYSPESAQKKLCKVINGRKQDEEEFLEKFSLEKKKHIFEFDDLTLVV